MFFSRYRLVKYIIPLFLLLYLFMVWLRPAIGVRQDEIFPFFSWALFSHTSEWETMENALVVHVIDGRKVGETRYLIPSREIRHQKTLKNTANVCVRREECDQVVEEWVYPIVRNVTRGDEVEFSIVEVSIDLRDVQRDIWELSSGEIDHSDFYRVDKVLGSWSTVHGPIWVSGFQSSAPFDDRWETIERIIDESEPIISVKYDVHLDGNQLIYTKESCDPVDTYSRFFLHIIPVDVDVLSGERRQYGFDNLDFDFKDQLYMGGERCIVEREIPGYDIRGIRTGQFISGQGNLWQADVELEGR